MAHDNIVITKIRFFPDSIIYLLFAEHFANILCQQKQYFKLCIGQFNLIIFTNHNPFLFINIKSFKIKLPLTAEPNIVTNPTDIVLLLDRSRSMAEARLPT